MKTSDKTSMFFGILAFLGLIALVKKRSSKDNTNYSTNNKNHKNPGTINKKPNLTPSKDSMPMKNFDFKVKTPSELEKGRSNAYPYLA
ncbi:MAG: hypothetical protein PSX81_03325 [bacterium]|nr:hypothetical protein [bacterium]